MHSNSAVDHDQNTCNPSEARVLLDLEDLIIRQFKTDGHYQNRPNPFVLLVKTAANQKYHGLLMTQDAFTDEHTARPGAKAQQIRMRGAGASTPVQALTLLLELTMEKIGEEFE